MSPAPTTEYPSTANTAPIKHETTPPTAAGGQLLATDISTGKKGLAGSVIAGAIIGGIVVVILIIAIFFGLRHRYRRSKGQTASTTEAGPEDEKEKEKCAEVDEASPRRCPICLVVFPRNNTQEVQSDIAVNQAGPIASPSSPQKSFDGTQAYPTQTNYSNITTHAPRPQSYRTGQSIIQAIDPSSRQPLCPTCALSAGTNTRPGVADLPTGSSKVEDQIYYPKSCVPSTSPPLPPGAMAPLPSPTLESYREQFMASPSPRSPPLSPPPQSPSSPGGNSLRRWIMSPLSRSGSVRTTLPPYERPASGLERRESDKKDESALAASVYTFM
ncbi:unnamed protein product [Rhizoctonia solani]|uniref:Uncharacterized protein n=1 Tax=Rhizoctonia solani TaxID=456999 RepID=A0A8H3B9T0_9AGAM|nr:unnamed protein product [Rhizoctonia solani]